VIEIELAGEPLAKGRVRVTKTGHAYTPERTLNYEARLAAEAQHVMAGRPLLEGPLAVEIEIRMSIPASKPKKWQEAARRGDIRPIKKPDLDNFAKGVDAWNLIVWQDDSQIVDLKVTKFYHDRPAFIARIRPLVDQGAFG
jgi:Holliday junction resolvase RusA-like endonuclease